MLAGDTFSPRQRDEILRAITNATRRSGLEFSVYVGPADGPPRAYARRRHAELGVGAPDAVLVFVDPAGRSLEIIIGSRACRRLDDRACALAAISMGADFALGNLAGGVVHGLRALADQVQPQSLQARGA